MLTSRLSLNERPAARVLWGNQVAVDRQLDRSFRARRSLFQLLGALTREA